MNFVFITIEWKNIEMYNTEFIIYTVYCVSLLYNDFFLKEKLFLKCYIWFLQLRIEFFYKMKISFESLLRFTKIGTCLTFSWPRTNEFSKFKFRLYDVLYGIFFLSALFLIIPLCTSVYKDWSDRLIMTKSICLACAVLQVAMKIIVCRAERHRFKVYHFWKNPFNFFQ